MLKIEELLSTRALLIEQKAQLTKSIDEQINAINILLNGGNLLFSDMRPKLIEIPDNVLIKGSSNWDELLVKAFKIIPDKTSTLNYLAELCLRDNPKYNMVQIKKRFRKEAHKLIQKNQLKVIENNKRSGYVYEYIGE